MCNRFWSVMSPDMERHVHMPRIINLFAHFSQNSRTDDKLRHHFTPFLLNPYIYINIRGSASRSLPAETQLFLHPKTNTKTLVLHTMLMCNFFSDIFVALSTSCFVVEEVFRTIFARCWCFCVLWIASISPLRFLYRGLRWYAWSFHGKHRRVPCLEEIKIK